MIQLQCSLAWSPLRLLVLTESHEIQCFTCGWEFPGHTSGTLPAVQEGMTVEHSLADCCGFLKDSDSVYQPADSWQDTDIVSTDCQDVSSHYLIDKTIQIRLWRLTLTFKLKFDLGKSTKTDWFYDKGCLFSWFPWWLATQFPLSCVTILSLNIDTDLTLTCRWVRGQGCLD